MDHTAAVGLELDEVPVPPGSLSLALLNLLPLLPLDGGHILFTLIEGARGRFLRREIYERVSMVGLALVLVLFFVGLSNDIGKLS